MTDDDDERMEEELRELDAARPDRPAPRVLPKAGAAADAPPKHSLLIKLLMLGDSGVGKTTLLKRYAEGKFDPMIASTAGVAYETQYVELEGRNIRVDIWDTAGQERFHVITQAYYAGAHGIVLAYDASEAGETSFNSEKEVGRGGGGGDGRASAMRRALRLRLAVVGTHVHLAGCAAPAPEIAQHATPPLSPFPRPRACACA